MNVKPKLATKYHERSASLKSSGTSGDKQAVRAFDTAPLVTSWSACMIDLRLVGDSLKANSYIRGLIKISAMPVNAMGIMVQKNDMSVIGKDAWGEHLESKKLTLDCADISS